MLVASRPYANSGNAAFILARCVERKCKNADCGRGLEFEFEKADSIGSTRSASISMGLDGKLEGWSVIGTLEIEDCEVSIFVDCFDSASTFASANVV